MSSSTTTQRTADELAQDSLRPSADVGTETFRKARPEIVGPEEPESPFPIKMAGAVQKGFGRGGKDLGCPTGTILYHTFGWNAATYGFSIGAANLPDESLHTMSSVTTSGVYYGFAQVISKEGDTGLSKEDQQVYPMAMSLGWNPFYKNERLSAVRIHCSLLFMRQLTQLK